MKNLKKANKPAFPLKANAISLVSNGVVITDATKKDNPIIFVNEAFTKISGYTAEEAVGKNCRFLQGTATSQNELDKIREAIKKGTRVHSVLKNYRKDGHQFWNELYITPIKDESGKVTNFIGIQNDITEKKTALDELENYKQHLERLVEDRTRELTKINHELRDEIEQRQKAQDKIASLYERLSHSADRLQSKINKLDGERVPLTTKERLGLHGLVSTSHIHTSKVAKDLSLSTSTLNTIKNRLIREGYMTRLNIPRIDVLGLSLLSVIMYDGPRDMSGDFIKQVRDKLNELIKRQSNLIYAINSEKSSVLISITKDYNAFKEFQDHIEQSTGMTGSSYRNVKTVHLPIERSRILEYFNYGPYLKSRLDLSSNHITKREKRLPRVKFTESDKRVIFGLTRYPDMSVTKLSQRLELSTPSVIKSRQKMFTHGLIKSIYRPDLKKLGTRLILATHHMFSTNNSLDVDYSFSNEYLSFLSTTDHFSLALFHSYKDLQTHLDSCPICSQRKNISEPYKTIIPIESVQFEKLNFASILKVIS